jgi:hypothetical protein
LEFENDLVNILHSSDSVGISTMSADRRRWRDTGNAPADKDKHDEASKHTMRPSGWIPTWHSLGRKGFALEALGRTTEADAAFFKAKELGLMK